MTTQQAEQTFEVDESGLTRDMTAYFTTFRQPKQGAEWWTRTNPQTGVDVHINRRTQGDFSTSGAYGIHPEYPTVINENGDEVQNSLRDDLVERRITQAFTEALVIAWWLEAEWKRWVPTENQELGKHFVNRDGEVTQWRGTRRESPFSTGGFTEGSIPSLDDEGFFGDPDGASDDDVSAANEMFN